MHAVQYAPEFCVWELTLRCNMRCVHCGSQAGRARLNELTVDECFVVADDLVNLGCRRATLIGGEVFLCPGWEKVGRKLSDAGVVVNIVTNGSLMGDRQVDQIREARLVNVAISLDGMEENHDRTRNVRGSFRSVLRAFERLRAERIPFAVVTALLDYNYRDLEPMHELLAEQGVSAWQIQLATAMGSMAGHADLRLDPARIPWVTGFIRHRRNRRMMEIYAGDDIGYFDENETYLRNRPGTISAWHGCQAGLRVVGIGSTGDVKGCESLYSDRFVEGNVRTEQLASIWNKEGNFAYNRQFDHRQLTGRCAHCDKASLCRGGCRGSCYFTAGSLFENPYCCYRPR
jgi:radical SAM protein with 4Fe4S-binding SPASM domain